MKSTLAAVNKRTSTKSVGKMTHGVMGSGATYLSL